MVLTSYNLSHIDEAELSMVDWDCICLDEAQNIKNAYTKQAAAIRRLKGRTASPRPGPRWKTALPSYGPFMILSTLVTSGAAGSSAASSSA